MTDSKMLSPYNSVAKQGSYCLTTNQSIVHNDVGNTW